MIGHSHSEDHSHDKNSNLGNIDRLEEMLTEKIRQAQDYVAKMSSFLPDPQPYSPSVYGLNTDMAKAADQPYDPRISYYQEFWKIYVKNENSLNQIKVLASESAVLKEKVAEIQVAGGQSQNLEQTFSSGLKSRTKKKARRLAADIEKKFRCPYDNCYKLYGSNVSLNLHIKLKHNGGNKTDREKIAQQICVAEINRVPLPNYNITFPPGFLEAYRKEYLKNLKKEIRC